NAGAERGRRYVCPTWAVSFTNWSQLVVRPQGRSARRADGGFHWLLCLSRFPTPGSPPLRNLDAARTTHAGNAVADERVCRRNRPAFGASAPAGAAARGLDRRQGTAPAGGAF